MNNSASFNPLASPPPHCEFFNFVPATQPIQDTDLIRQLPFIPGLKEILMLRQVHALEHATVWVLGESDSDQITSMSKNHQFDNKLLGDLSTEQEFYLHGQVNIASLQRAVRVALQRLTGGESDLAVHPRCGTNVSVGMLLTVGLAWVSIFCYHEVQLSNCWV